MCVSVYMMTNVTLLAIYVPLNYYIVLTYYTKL